MAKERDYKHDYKLQKKRPHEKERRMERQRARRAMDKADTGTVTKRSPRRAGKDIAHTKALSKGGSNSDGVTLQSPSKNRKKNYSKGRPPGSKNRK